MDPETALQIGHIQGRLEGHDEEISGMRGQISEIHGMVGGIDGKLDRILGSGPHPIVTAAQSATEPKTDTIVGKAMALAGKPIAIHALYLGGGVIILLIFAIWHSGRPASDFLPGLREHTRSGIGPIDQHERHP